MQYSIEMIKKICQRVVELLCKFAQLPGFSHGTTSPLTLHCMYMCAANFSWLYSGTNDPQWASGKLIAEDYLRSMRSRWRVAGESILFRERCQKLIIAGTYLELLRISDLENDETHMQR